MTTEQERQAHKDRASELGVPSAEEIYIFAERLNLVRREILEEMESVGDFANGCHFVGKVAASVNKFAEKVNAQQFEVGQVGTIHNLRPKYLVGAKFEVKEVDLKKGTLWGTILTETGGQTTKGAYTGIPTSCFMAQAG
jgi:hypothetical protein